MTDIKQLSDATIKEHFKENHVDDQHNKGCGYCHCLSCKRPTLHHKGPHGKKCKHMPANNEEVLEIEKDLNKNDTVKNKRESIAIEVTQPVYGNIPGINPTDPMV